MTEKRTAYVYIFDGYADWEPAPALAELRRTFGFFVKTCALTSRNIVSMGGLKLTPDLPLENVRPESASVVIFPGGGSWTLQGEIEEVSALVKAVQAAGRPVAAIGGATLAFAYAGLLNENKHTSNGADFISKYVLGYTGQALYQKVPAVRDNNVITAGGPSAFLFAAEIFRAVAPKREKDIATYLAKYSGGISVY